MKKHISILAWILALLLLVGCATTPANAPAVEDEKPDPTQAAEEIVDKITDDGEIQLKYVGMCFPQFGSPWYVMISDQITSVLEAKGIKVETAACDNNHARQLEIIENYGQKGVDGIILFPIGASEIGGTLERLQNQGVRVVIMTNKVDRGYDAMLLTNYPEQGALCAQMAAEWIDKTFPDAAPGSIEVGMMVIRMSEEANAVSDGMARITEFTDKAVIVEEYEGAFSDPEIKSRESVENMLSSHPNIKCLLCYAASTAADEAVMNTPGIDLEHFGIFTNTKIDVILQRISASRNNESVIRGVTASGSGDYYYVGEAMLGNVVLNENKIAYDELTPITADNIDEFLHD